MIMFDDLILYEKVMYVLCVICCSLAILLWLCLLIW